MIISIRYTDETGTTISVEYDSGTSVSMNFPSNTWRDAEINEWLDVPNTISPYDKYYGKTLDQAKETGYSAADTELLNRISIAEHNPAVGVNLSDSGTLRENGKRNNKAKKKNNSISDADDNLFDHIDSLADAAELIRDDIEAAVDYDTVDGIVSTIPEDANWPVWVPIA